jgi:hypothetical protein
MADEERLPFDPVTTEERDGAIRMIREQGPETALAFEIVMQWFEEHLQRLLATQNIANARTQSTIQEQARSIDQLRAELLAVNVQLGLAQERASRSVEVYRDV